MIHWSWLHNYNTVWSWHSQSLTASISEWLYKGILSWRHSSWLIHLHTVDCFMSSWCQCKYFFVSEPKIIVELFFILCSERLSFIQWFASLKTRTCQHVNCPWSRIEVRPTVLTLSCDLQFQSPVSRGSYPHTYKRSVDSKDRVKQTDGQMDRHTDGGNCITSRANTVGKYFTR